METVIILSVGAILLCGGCVGLAIVRFSNPFLKGLGWLGCSFAAGSLAAGVLALSRGGLPDYQVLLTDTFILLAYVSLQVCLEELTVKRHGVPWLGFALLAIQPAAFLVLERYDRVREGSVVILGLLLAVQTARSALLLYRRMRPGVLAPMWFLAVLLLLFAGYNMVRSAVILVEGTPSDPALPNPLEELSAVIFLGEALGLGFGVFWLTSAQMRVALQQQANTDPLTGVSNRRSFRDACEREILRSLRSGEPFSLILLDLDHFKQINDSFGHDAGDSVLIGVVERMRRSVRNVDILGRWGGEEFVALLPAADGAAALRVAERMRENVESLVLTDPRKTRPGAPVRQISITISLGVATYRTGSGTLDDLLSRCDEAMYRAKAEGRNRIVLAEV